MRAKRSSNNNGDDEDFRDFLNDAYPGAQQAPTQMVQMLASPQTKPDDIVDSAAIFYKESQDTCQAIEAKCPENFFRLCEGCKCLHDPETKMTLIEGNAYCKNLGSPNSQLFQFERIKELQLLDEYINKGLCIS